MSKIMLKNMLLENPSLSAKMRKEYFPKKSVKAIRDWLEQNGLDRHLPLEFDSTEVAIITPKGIAMQVRASDNNSLGLWGGVLQDGEEPIYGAVRELKEETGLEIAPENLQFVGIDTHTHTYANGDMAKFHAYRYIVTLSYVPEIKTDVESTGYILLTPILKHQKDFVQSILDKMI